MNTTSGRQPATISVLGVLQGLTSLPIPGPSWIGVGQYIVGKAVPSTEDKFLCGTIGVAEIPWTFTSGGKAVLVMPMPAHYIHFRNASWTAQSCPPTYRDCGVTHRQVVEITKR